MEHAFSESFETLKSSCFRPRHLELGPIDFSSQEVVLIFHHPSYLMKVQCPTYCSLVLCFLLVLYAFNLFLSVHLPEHFEDCDLPWYLGTFVLIRPVLAQQKDQIFQEKAVFSVNVHGDIRLLYQRSSCSEQKYQWSLHRPSLFPQSATWNLCIT